jgi:DNA-cytosine methyltransferase
MEKLSVFDLFSGIGGFSLGLEKTEHFETKYFSEVEKYPRSVLAHHWPDVPNLGDITKIDFTQYKCDVICGGFPCTDISIASKSKEGIYGSRSKLWFEFFRAIEESRPKYVIIENVFALIGRGLDRILSDLAFAGYDATWTILDSKYFGVPQRRRRVYIIGVRDGIPTDSNIFKFRERSTGECSREVQLINSSFEFNFEKERGFKKDFTYYTRQRSDEFAEKGLASTLTKRDYKSATDIIIQNGIIRKVTPTERLSLQGFPIDWHVEGSDTEKYKANGMSVPVVEWIGNQLYNFHREGQDV